MNQKVDDYIKQSKFWRDELIYLRNLVLSCALEEQFKWRGPCYTYQNKNLFLLVSFKAYCGFSFSKGALLKDDAKLLESAGEHAQTVRMMKFQSIEEIQAKASIIKAYIQEAIEIEKAGTRVDFSASKKIETPEELKEAFHDNTQLEKAFKSLTPGRQRAYLIHFTGSAQSKTRKARIDRYASRILKGYGMNDCICGKSQKMPRCDGAHKNS